MNEVLKAVIEEEFNETWYRLGRLEALLEKTKTAILGEEQETRYHLELVKERTELKIVELKIDLKKLALMHKKALVA